MSDPIFREQARAVSKLLTDLENAIQSAQPEQRWIPFQFRPMTDEEKEEYLRWDVGEDEEILCGKLPDDEQEILVSYSGYVFIDTFERDEGVYLDDMGEIEHGMAWQPLPPAYREKNHE